MVTQNKTPGEYLALYAKGWTEGDVESILSATTPGYTFLDPRTEKVNRDRFPAYFQEILELSDRRPFMEISDVVVQSQGEGLVAWCWWEIPGTDIQGSGFIRVGPDGVLSEKIAYYA